MEKTELIKLAFAAIGKANKLLAYKKTLLPKGQGAATGNPVGKVTGAKQTQNNLSPNTIEHATVIPQKKDAKHKYLKEEVLAKKRVAQKEIIKQQTNENDARLWLESAKGMNS